MLPVLAGREAVFMAVKTKRPKGCYFWRHVFTSRVHGRRFTRPVNTARKYGYSVTRMQQFADRSRHTATGTHMRYGITQCYYLPPGRGDIPALTLGEAGTRFSDPRGIQG